MQTVFAADAERHLSDHLPEQVQRALLGRVVIRKFVASGDGKVWPAKEVVSHLFVVPVVTRNHLVSFETLCRR